MQVTIDTQNNRAWLQGVAVQPRQQWLCAFLQLLVQGSDRADRRLVRADLELALRRFGRGPEPLHPKQAQRLVDGLRTMFSRHGLAEDFDARFRCEAACKTSGPWRWTPLPGDEFVVRDSAGASQRSSGREVHWLPTVTSDEFGQPAASVALQMQQALAHQWDGNTALALDALETSPVWEKASRAMLALRHLKRADLLVTLRDFKASEQALEAAEALASEGNTMANSVLRSLAHLSRARWRYMRSPSLAFQGLLDAQYGVNDALKPLPSDVNLSGFADRWNLLMLGQRRWLEANVRSADPEAWAENVSAMQRLGQGAIFMCQAGQFHERAQNVCANLAYAFQQLSELTTVRQPEALRESNRYLDLSMQWHANSLSYRLRFDLPDNSAYELIFLGELWLSGPRARAAFERYAFQIAWLGLRPDDPAFYARAWECAAFINDPRQMAYCALNELGFARHTRSSDMHERALQKLDTLLTVQPDLVKVLTDEGYTVPTSHRAISTLRVDQLPSSARSPL